MTAHRWLGLPLTCLVTAAACAGDEPDVFDTATTTALIETAPDTPTDTPPGSVVASTVDAAADTSVAEVAVELPDTPAGEQLRWVLEEALDAPDSAYPDHFSPEVLAQIPVAQLRAALADSGASVVVEIVTSSPTEIVVIVNEPTGELVLSITVETEPPHLITDLLAQPTELPDPPTSWEGIGAALAGAAPRFTYLAAEVDDVGGLTTIRTGGSTDSVPLGSGFKLYVLGALVQAIEEGEISWDDELTITDELKSLSSGELQDRPAGENVSVREAAEKMIQISDNTATDMLIDRLGRDAVEAVLTPMGLGAESQQRTLPFLTTREFFTLKWGIDRSELDSYVAADLAGRRAVLASLGDRLPTVADVDLGVPVAIDDVEWFATAPELAAAHVWLDAYRDRQAFEPLAAILGTNPGVPLDSGVWSHVAFKPGSEPGVVFLGWLLQPDDGRRFVVVVSASNPDAAVDELQVASAAQGIIELIATEP